MRSTILSLTLALVLPIIPAQANDGVTHKEYDKRGNFLGQSRCQGLNCRHYDKQGNFEGRSELRNGTLRNYDKQGNFRGSQTLTK